MTEMTQMPDRLSTERPRPDQLPRRPRRRYLNRGSATLLAVVTCAIGFYIGVRVEKSRVASAPATVAAAAGFSGAGARPTSATGSTAGTSATSKSGSNTGAGSTGFTGPPGAAGFAARFGGAGGGSTGTVASVNGKTLVLTETGGNTVKVSLNSATKITKSEAVGRDKIHPGDTIVVSGVTKKSGTLSAATITDSGTSSTAGSGGTTGSTTSSTSGTSGSSAVGSLFSGR